MSCRLEIPLMSTLEDNIAKYYGTIEWMDIAKHEVGISSVSYNRFITYIEFATEAHKTWFLLRWS